LKDFAILILLVILVIFITNKYFSGLEKIRYFSTDASIHYLAAKEFSENEQLLNKAQGTQTYRQMLPMLYTNVGIAFKVFGPIVGEVNLYKVYIMYDILIFLFIGLTFYFVIKKAIKNNWCYIYAFIATIIYMVGYPLNNLITGFGYLGFCLLFINTIILVMQYIERKDIIRKLKLLVIFALNMSVMFSYNIFAVFVYISELLYFIVLNKRNGNKLLNKKLIIDVVITLIIPGILGLIYFIAPNVEAVKVVAIEGYIYKNMWSNFVLFIPFILYYIYKSKSIDYKMILFVTSLLCILVFLIVADYKIISEYYVYKVFYVFWGITIMLCFYGMMKFVEKSNKRLILITICFILYITGMFTVPKSRIIPIKEKVEESLESCFDIYCMNHEITLLKIELNKNQLDTIKYIKNNNILNTENPNMLFVSDYIQDAWINVLLNYKNREGNIEDNNYNEQIEKWNNGYYEYLVCFKESEIYRIYGKNINYEKAKLQYSNTNVEIYKMKE